MKNILLIILMFVAAWILVLPAVTAVFKIILAAAIALAGFKIIKSYRKKNTNYPL